VKELVASSGFCFSQMSIGEGEGQPEQSPLFFSCLASAGGHGIAVFYWSFMSDFGLGFSYSMQSSLFPFFLSFALSPAQYYFLVSVFVTTDIPSGLA